MSCVCFFVIRIHEKYSEKRERMQLNSCGSCLSPNSSSDVIIFGLITTAFSNSSLILWLKSWYSCCSWFSIAMLLCNLYHQGLERSDAESVIASAASSSETQLMGYFLDIISLVHLFCWLQWFFEEIFERKRLRFCVCVSLVVVSWYFLRRGQFIIACPFSLNEWNSSKDVWHHFSRYISNMTVTCI
jgi:hypothetical protein